MSVTFPLCGQGSRPACCAHLLLEAASGLEGELVIPMSAGNVACFTLDSGYFRVRFGVIIGMNGIYVLAIFSHLLLPLS